MTEADSHIKYSIDMEPVGRRTQVDAGQTLLEAAQSAGVELTSLCGGVGSCDSCRVKIIDGDLSSPNQIELDALGDERISSGYRLACQAVPRDDVKIYIPPESLTAPQRLQVEGEDVKIDLDPVVESVDINLNQPCLNDLRADATRLIDAVAASGHSGGTEVQFPLLDNLSNQLRTYNWTTRIVLNHNEIIAALPQKSPVLGVAVDIGTTKLAAYLINLSNGETLAKTGTMNPQIAYGEDVVSRIAYACDHENGRDVLQSTLVNSINELIDKLCSQSKVSHQQVVDLVAVGNTAMHHLLAHLPVQQLGVAPYIASVNVPLNVRASVMGIKAAAGAYVHLPPNIAGYVGADHVAMLLATSIWKKEATVIALDIGTNTEISLFHDGKLSSCSCASGPAFEGAHIKNGMRAAPGAIERVQIESSGILTQTISGQAPIGICGSGVLDVVSEMYANDIIDSRGAFIDNAKHVQLSSDGKNEFVLIQAEQSGHGEDIVITRSDVNEIQLAKAAIRAGIDILLKHSGVNAGEIDQFIVAGAFGTYIDINSAVNIGMFPDIARGKFKQVGNAAGVGAKQMLLSYKKRLAASGIAEMIKYIELTIDPDFTDTFMQAMYLKRR